MGPEVKQLEDKLAAYVGVKHCITASSGTDTLLIAMMAWALAPATKSSPPHSPLSPPAK
jgi:UDP-2-acetamido-2-deoxy-ribo-hexuluronate aminotransferase